MTNNLVVRSSSAEFLIFERQTHDRGIQVRFENGDLWLTQKAIGELFNTTRNNITMHINDIYNAFEMDENSTSKKFLLVQNEGNREVKRNIDAIEDIINEYNDSDNIICVTSGVNLTAFICHYYNINYDNKTPLVQAFSTSPVIFEYKTTINN